MSPDTTRIYPMMDKVQEFLGQWLEDHLKQIWPVDWWERCVMDVLSPEQRENVLNDGAKSPSGLDLAMQISVFRGNWLSLRRKFHLNSQLYDDAIAVKRVRNKYSHKKSSEDYDSRFEHDMETVRLFLKGLGAPAEVANEVGVVNECNAREVAMTFDNIIEAARTALPDNVRRAPWIGLEHGVVPLDTEQKLNQYLAAYGRMHVEKIRLALDSLDDASSFFNSPILIVDWGCGQALATCSTFDWMRKKAIDLGGVSRVCLVEPSRLALKRAREYVAQYERRFEMQLEVSSINKYANDIEPGDFDISGISTTLHLFSNILDIETVNLNNLSALIKHAFTGRQIFCCVGPQNNGATRIVEFAGKFGVTEEQIEARCAGRLAHCKGTVSLLTFVIDTGRASVVKKAHVEPTPAVVDTNIALQRLLKRYAPKEDVLDRILQFYQMSTELEQLKEPKASNTTLFATRKCEDSIVISFKDNCDGQDNSVSGNECLEFARACKENAGNRWPKDVLCALEVVWDAKMWPLLHYVKPVVELEHFDYCKDEIVIPLQDFTVNIACADLLEISDENVAAIEQTLHSDRVTLDLIAQRITDVIGPAAELDRSHVRLSLCDKNLTLAQTYAELGRMNASAIRRNPLMEAFLENAEMNNRIESVLPGELISTVPMDDPQREAVAHALGNRVSVIVGPPGCGKTQLLLNLLANALVRGKKVLVASKNNKAVDNVCDRFRPFDRDGSFIRFGSKNFVRDNTLPALSGLLNRAQAPGYDDAGYQATAEEFRKAIVAVKAKEELEEKLAKHKSNIAAEEEEIALLGDEMEATKKELDDIRERYIAEKRAQLDEEYKRQCDFASEIEKRIAEIKDDIVSEHRRFTTELDELKDRNADFAAQEHLDHDMLSDSIAKLQRLGADIEYRIGGFRGLFVRKTAIVKTVLDAIWELPGGVQDFLRGIDSRRSIRDFASRHDVVSFCGKLGAGLLSILRYRNDVEKLQKKSDRTIARLEKNIEDAEAKKAEAKEEIADIRKLLLNEKCFLDWIDREHCTDIADRQANTKANFACLEESVERKKRHLSEERSCALETERTLRDNANLAKRVFGIEFGSRFVSLVLAHNLHQTGTARAVTTYKAYLPDQLWQDDSIQSAGRFLDVIRLNSVTSLSIRNAFPITENLFDMLVIDEASQCDVASALPLIFRAKQIVIIGDPKQLRHISKLDESEELALKRHLRLSNLAYLKYAESSLWDFARNWIPWCGNEAPCILRNHYRCHADIIGYSNEMFYRDLGGLKVCTPQRPNGPNGGITWLDVKGKQKSAETNVNEMEACKVVEIAKQCAQKYPEYSIGIVTPFTDQAKRINAALPTDICKSILVDTVHSFQGDEKDIMIYSLVVTDNSPDSKIRWIDRKSPNLVNVAVTRARRRLIIVGNRQYVRTHSQSNLPLGHLAMYVSALERAVESAQANQ